MKIFKGSLAICVLAVCAGISARADDNPAQAAARATLMKTLYGGEAAPAAASTNVAPPVLIDSSGVVGEKSTNPPPVMVAQPMSSDNEAQAKARAALEEKMQETDAQAPAKPAMAKANKNYPGGQMGFKPIMAPALPITATQQMQLDALLNKYKADLITPEEYQKQRAAILAKP